MPRDGRADLNDLVTAIAEIVLAEESPGKPLHPVGHSSGTTVALRLATMHRRRIGSLTFVEPVLVAVARDVAPVFFAAHARNRARFAEAFEAGDRRR